MSYYHLSFETALTREPKPVSIIRVDPTGLEAPRRALEVLRAGGLVVFPTEDGYLVGCSAADPAAITRLREASGAGAGSLTTLVARRESAGGTTPAARVPRHLVALALVQGAGSLTATPGVPSGRPAPNAQRVVFHLGDKVDLVLDAGPIHRQPAAPAAAAGGGR